MKIFLISTALLLGIIALMVLGFLFWKSSDKGQIIRVKISDSNRNILKTLESEDELVEFRKHWNNAKKLKRDPAKRFKGSDTSVTLDLEFEKDKGGRYFYHSDGRYVLLTYFLDPVYQIQNPSEFNLLLGIKDESSE